MNRHFHPVPAQNPHQRLHHCAFGNQSTLFLFEFQFPEFRLGHHLAPPGFLNPFTAEECPDDLFEGGLFTQGFQPFGNCSPVHPQNPGQFRNRNLFKL